MVVEGVVDLFFAYAKVKKIYEKTKNLDKEVCISIISSIVAHRADDACV